MNLFSFTRNQYGRAIAACSLIPMALFAFVQFTLQSGWPDDFEPALSLTGNYQRDSLKEALGKAALVISGKVLSTNIPDTTMRQNISEHDPLIRKAVIQVQQVLKGKKIKGTVAVYYASSDDVRWYQSPKPFVGQVAIFLLHSDNVSKQLNSEVYTILHYLDVQEWEKKSRIQKLLQDH